MEQARPLSMDLSNRLPLVGGQAVSCRRGRQAAARASNTTSQPIAAAMGGDSTMSDQKGLLVAVLGPDGSGKSTLISGLEARLASRGFRVHCFHLRPHFGRAPVSNGPVTDPHGKRPRGQISSIVKLMLWWADYVIGHYIGVRPKLKHSGIVVFDRYYHDLMVDPIRYRYGSSLGLARLVGRLLPQPDLVTILDAPTEVLLSRKREVSPEESQRQRTAYGDLASAFENACILDSERPAENNVVEVEKLIVQRMTSRERQKDE